MKNTEPKKHILILGGGFAGVNALISLEKLFAHDDAVEITMINNENFLLFTPMLSEVAIGTVDPRHIVTPIRELCNKALFHRGEIQAIDLGKQTVTVLYADEPQEQEILNYDQLVLAIGSITNMKVAEGAEAHAYDFKEIVDALQIRSHILDVFEQADTCHNADIRKALLTFSVIGAGYSGVEVAAAVDEMVQRLLPLYPTISPQEVKVLILEAEKRILPTLPQDLSQYAHRELIDKGIQILLNKRVKMVEPHGVTLESGEKITSDTVIWTTGIALPDVIMKLPAAQKDKKGRPIGTPELQFSGYKNVWAIGDDVRTPLPDHQDGFYSATAQSAVREGKHVAKNIYRVLHGQAPVPFRYHSRGEMVVLGHNSAVAKIFGFKIRGFPAWVVWRLYYLSALPQWKKKIRVAIDWVLNMFGPLETAQIQFHTR